MLAYNFKKHNIQKSDHVRDIIAKLEAKQSKTGLSLYAQQGSITSTPGGSPNNEEKSSFPNIKRARKKAQKRMATDKVRYSYSNEIPHARSQSIPHRVPGNSLNLPPVSLSHGVPKTEERVPHPCNLQEQQFDKEKLDINANPFGYNRKTLAFQTRNINYVVEWPETWPFKITSFQRRKKTLRKVDQKRSVNPVPSTNHDTPVEEEERTLPDTNKARVLAPVDHPVKQTIANNKPYVESSLLKRGVRKLQPKESANRLVLISREGKDLEFASLRSGPSKNNDDISKSSKSPIMPEISREQIDSCPPSTPVPGGLEPVRGGPEPVSDEQEPVSNDHHSEAETQEKNEVPNGQEPEKLEDKSYKDVYQETSSMLNDIVNQIIAEDKPLTI